MSRRPFIVGNWKMNLDEPSAAALAQAVAAGLADVPDVDLGVAPPFPFLRAVLDRAAGTRLAVGGQDVHFEDRGAFTGAVAGPMLAGMGATFAIVGHSERRRLFAETDEAVAKKIAAALRNHLTPILCIGETEEDRLTGRTLDVVARQLRWGLALVPVGRGDEVTVAYEPVWSIGTGRVPTVEQVREVHAAVRRGLAEIFGSETAEKIRILYGGSATPESVPDLVALEDVDGALVGGASLDPVLFLRIAALAQAQR